MDALNEFLQTPVGPWVAGRLVSAGVAFLGAVVTRFVIVYVVGRRLRLLAEKTETRADDLAVEAVIRPLGLLILATGVYFAFRILAVVQPSILDEGLKAFAIVATLIVAWSAFKLVTAGFLVLQERAALDGTHYDAALMPLLRKASKIFIGAIGVLMVLQNLGYSVSGLIAGLGIGGLAFGLAAKDTIANLFGSVAILMDRPFRVGDWVTADGASGVVEEIGLRSTRIRTFDKTVVSIPNQALANAKVENHELMTRRRVKLTIGVTYDTPPARLRELIAALEQLLRAAPGVDRDRAQVKFTDFAESSLAILIQYYTHVLDYAEYMRIRQEINLGIMDTVSSLGVRFALPARMVTLEGKAEG